MSTLYAAAYLAPSRQRPPDSPCSTASAFYATVSPEAFPYDIGDDPGFFAARYHKGPVTWGVRRPDVRSAIEPGDWMVFFSAQKDEPPTTTTRYRFVAALCVEARITHTNIFDPGSARLYRDYLNLLIRPSGDGWEHFEPGLHPSQWHDDWMWRLCARRGLRKADVAASGRRHQPGDLLTLGTRPLPIADCYVIFSTSTSVIVPDPPLVAAHRRGDAAERWQADDRSNMIRELVFGASPRGLRTDNPQQRHRHFRRTLVDQGWPDSLRRALSS